MRKRTQLIGVRAPWWPEALLSYKFGLCGVMPVLHARVIDGSTAAVYDTLFGQVNVPQAGPRYDVIYGSN